jgi:hypothetical protein
MARGVPIEQALEDDRSEHPKNLAMVNIEAVNTRWITDPAGFLAAADAAVYGDPDKKIGYGKYIADTMLDSEKEPRPEAADRFKPVWKPPVLGPDEKDPGGVWVVEIRGYTDHKDAPEFLKKALLRNLHKFDTFAKGENKVGKFIVGVQDPVKGRVSHAFLYNTWMVPDAQPNDFVYIKGSYLDKLLADRRSSGAGGRPGGIGPGPGVQPPVGPPPGPGGPPEGGAPAVTPIGPDWTPLTKTGTGDVGTPGVGIGAPPVGPVGTPAGGTGEKKDGFERRRYEFVVMFIWREPVPSGSGTPGEATAPDPAAPGGR